MQTFCFSLFVELDLMVVVSFCYSLLSLFSNSMVRTKTTPKKEREGRIILRLSEEWARLAREVRQEGERSERVRRSRRLARQARKEKRPSSPIHYPSPAKRSSPVREVVQMLEEMVKQVEEAGQLDGWRRWGDPHHRCQPNSWPRWLQRLGHLPWGRSLPKGSSTLPLGARPHGRSS